MKRKKRPERKRNGNKLLHITQWAREIRAKKKLPLGLYMLWIERTQAMMILTYKTINTHTENGDVGLSFFSLARCVSDWASFILRRFFSSVFFFCSFDVSNKATTIYSYSFDIRAPYFCNSSFFYSAPIFLWAIVLCSSGNAACAQLPPSVSSPKQNLYKSV